MGGGGESERGGVEEKPRSVEGERDVIARVWDKRGECTVITIKA